MCPKFASLMRSEHPGEIMSFGVSPVNYSDSDSGEHVSLVVGRASDLTLRGPGFKPCWGTMLGPSARHVYSLKYWLIHRKPWLFPDMAEKLLTGTLTKPTRDIVCTIKMC